jgi:hypothetical protein
VGVCTCEFCDALILVTCVLVFTVFCIVCTVFLYSFVYVYVCFFVVSVLPPSDNSIADDDDDDDDDNNNNNDKCTGRELSLPTTRVLLIGCQSQNQIPNPPTHPSTRALDTKKKNMKNCQWFVNW